MRARYKKVLKPAIKAIKVLNQTMEQSSKFKGRYFIKPIAFITRPEDRAKNNNYFLCQNSQKRYLAAKFCAFSL